MAELPAWRTVGDWFDVCECSVPCPCTWAQPPTFGHCDFVLVWHIREGSYGDVPLEGLNVVALGNMQGALWGDHEVTMAILMDDRADPEQREALQMIFSGQVGGWPATFGELVGADVLGLEFVPISVEVAPDLAYWRAEIPGRLLARGEALSGPTTPPGERVQVLNPPGAEVGVGRVATYGVASDNQVEAFGQSWDWAGRSSKHMEFDWSGPERLGTLPSRHRLLVER